MAARRKFFVNGGGPYAFFPGMGATRDRQLGWLQNVIEKTGLSVPQLAAKAKIDPSTISKFRAGQIETMRERTVMRLAQVAGISMPDIPGLSEGDAVEFDIAEMPDLSGIAGENRHFALKVKTHAMEKAGIAPGDILVFDGGAHPVSGQIVCAQIVDYRLGTAETIVRHYDKPYLLALTDDPAHLRPLIVDDDKVQIRGVLLKQVRVKMFGDAA